MTEVAPKPDAPFLNGRNGKYRLLVKTVTPRFGHYEYELVDAEGREYNTISEGHYAENQLLRCMVSFGTINARFSVLSVAVCKKQDLAISVADEKKLKVRPILSPLVESKAWVPFRELDDPVSSRKIGIYRLCVIDISRREKNNLYLLVDAANRQYRTISKKRLPIGSIVPCLMTIEVTKRGTKAYVASFDSTKMPRPHKHKSGRQYSSSYGNNDMPVPAAGDHFHLIYTPMGNKR